MNFILSFYREEYFPIHLNFIHCTLSFIHSFYCEEYPCIFDPERGWIADLFKLLLNCLYYLLSSTL